jgi:hypothetical protein
MANKLLDRHTRLTKEIETLEAAVAGAATGIDKKEQDFNYQKWVRKWRVSKSASLNKVLRESRRGKGLKEKSLTIGPVGRYFTDPKKLLKQLKDQQAFLEKNLGAKYTKNMDQIDGITSGRNLRTLLLGTVNPFYERKFDKDIFWKERELELQAQNKFKAQNRDTWHETYDDPYKGWRSLLPETHSSRPGSPNAKPNNPLLKVDRDNVENGDSPSTTVTPTDSTSNNNRNKLGLYQGHTYNVKGGGGWHGRGANILTSDGDITSLSINQLNKDWNGVAPGETLGVMTRGQRKQYKSKLRELGINYPSE